jgi:hypothetical protein
VVGSTVRDTIVGAGARIEGSTITGSVVGGGVEVRDVTWERMVAAPDEAAPAR